MARVAFLGNVAVVGGSAMYVGSIEHGLATILNVNVTLQDISAWGNTDNIIKTEAHIRSYNVVPVVMLQQIRWVTIEGTTETSLVFGRNFGLAVAAYSSSVELRGQQLYYYNSGIYGGAIGLYYQSRLIIDPSAQVVFLQNRALYGGAIYADNRQVGSCPIILPNAATPKTLLNFSLNSAELGGRDIYITVLKNCHNIIEQISATDPNIDVSSPPNKLCPCNDSSFEQNGMSTIMNCNTSHHLYTVYPGKSIAINVIAVDDANHSVYAPVSANFYENELVFSKITNWEISSNQVQLVKQGQCTRLNYTIQLKTDSWRQVKGKISLSVYGHLPTLSFDVIMRKCPPGFYLASSKCVCNDFLKKRNIIKNCNIDDASITLQQRNSWIGTVRYDGEKLVSANGSEAHIVGYAWTCPTGYCRSGEQHVKLAQQNDYCHDHKTGILCGECSAGYSITMAGTDPCMVCPDAYYYVMPIYLTTATSFILATLAFKITVSNGWSGGIVFYANVAVLLDIDSLLPSSNLYLAALQNFIYILNFAHGFTVCFYDGMTKTAKVAIQFVYPVYMWSLVVLLIVLSRFSTRVSNWTSHSSIQVLASLFYLSFAKLLLTIIDILTPATVHTSSGSYTVWYYNGNIPYWSDKGHAALLAMAATAILVYLLPFLFFTTFGSCLTRYWRRHVLRIRPLVDAYHGPYRTRWGCWFGVRVWLLLYMYITYSQLSTYSLLLVNLLHLVPLVIFTGIQVYYKPFTSSTVNTLETLFLGNLIFLYIVKIALANYDKWQHISAGLLVSLMLLITIAMVGSQVYRTIHNRFFPTLSVHTYLSNFTDSKREADQLEDSNTRFREPLLENASM